MSFDEVDPEDFELNRFWKDQDLDAAFSAEHPEFKAACNHLGLNLTKDAEFKYQLEDHFSTPLTPTHLLIQGCSLMAERERSKVKSGITGDDCGVGKTILSLLHVAFEYERVKAAHAKGKEVDCRPTLILCPADKPEQRLPTTDPETTRLVILSTSTTWARRIMSIKKQSSNLSDDSEADLNNSDQEKDAFHTRPKSQGRLSFVISDPQKAATPSKKAPKPYPRKYYKALTKECVMVRPAARNANEDRDASVDDQSSTYASYFENFFRDVVVVDEGHQIKITRTLSHHSVSVVYVEVVLILSATSMINSAVDLPGYLVLLWRQPWDVETSADHLSYHGKPDIDFTPKSTEEYVIKEEYLEATNNERLYVPNPRRFVQLINKDLLKARELSAAAFPPILSIFQFRRNTATKINAWGREMSLGDSIPIYQMVFVELNWSKLQEDIYTKIDVGIEDLPTYKLVMRDSRESLKLPTFET